MRVDVFIDVMTDALAARGFNYLVWEVDSKFIELTTKKDVSEKNKIKRAYESRFLEYSGSLRSFVDYEAMVIEDIYERGEFYKRPTFEP